MVSTLAQSLDLTFKRIQFTPDLMPTDITGTEVIQEDPQTRQRSIQVPARPDLRQHRPGRRNQPHPAQDAGRHARSDAGAQGLDRRQDHPMKDPFFVLATQNPIEQEGTYPLPEAQLDRFLLYIKVDYPSDAEEWEIARRVTTGQMGEIEPVLPGDDIIELQKLVSRVPVSDQVSATPGRWSRARGPARPKRPDFVNSWVSWGAGPRGVLTLSHLPPRPVPSSTAATTPPPTTCRPSPSRALRHRIASNYAAQAADATASN